MPNAVRLVSYTRFEDFWDGALLEWSGQVGKTAWAASKPTVILSPDTPRSGFIREQMVRRSNGLLGIAFWNPGQLRRYLFEKQFPENGIATQEDLVLLMRMVIEESVNQPLWKPLGDDPKRFLAGWDSIIAANADRNLIFPEWRALAKAFEAKLEAAGLSSVQQADWSLHAQGNQGNLLLGNLVIWGIGPAHARLYPLLQAAAAAAESVLWGIPVCDRESGILWQGSLEQRYGPAEPLISFAEEPFRPLVDAAEFGGTASTLEDGSVEVAIAPNRFGEVEGIVDAVERAYRTTENSRIGIVLPVNSYLSREVVRRLIEKELPTHDAFGHFPITPDRQRLFTTWLDYQRRPATETAHRLLRDLESLQMVDEATVGRIEKAWENARINTLNDTIEILLAWMQSESDRNNGAAIKWSQEWRILPESASMDVYLEWVGQPLERFGLAHELEAVRGGWVNRARALSVLKRDVFIEWLGETLSVPGKHRDPKARDVFSPIQVISYDQVGGQFWTHLLLGGLNEGLVPGVIRENPFLYLDASERHFKTYRKVGNQGEGHVTLDDQVGFLLDEREQRALMWRTLLDAIQETGEGIRISATLSNDHSSRDAVVLSEYFLRIARAMPEEWDLPRLEASGDQGMDSIKQTVEQQGIAQREGIPLPEQAAYSHQERWNVNKPFDEYTFGLRKGNKPLELAARQWESLLKHPAAVWLTAIARVEKVERFQELPSIPLSKGILVHQFLAKGTTTQFEVLSEPQQLVAAVTQAALVFTQRLEVTYRSTGKAVSDRLVEHGAIIRRLVQRLAEAVAARSFIGEMARELKIPAGSVIQTRNGPLQMRGRPDLMLKEKPGDSMNRWVIDYKTGADKPLTLKRVEAGDNLQLILYAQFFADMWNQPVSVCLLSPGMEMEEQVRVEPNGDVSGWLDLLAEMGNSGQLGYAQDSNQEYGYAPDYPMAFLKPPSSVWKTRRALTYPNWPETK